MSLFMDIHSTLRGTDAQSLVSSHINDPEIPQKYGVRYLKCWSSEQGSDKVFCLFEAQDKEAVNRVHDECLNLPVDEIIQVREVSSEIGPTTTYGLGEMDLR